MKISAVFLALVLISLVFFQVQMAQAHEIKEGAITQERSQIATITTVGGVILSVLGLGSLTSIPILGTILALVIGLIFVVGDVVTVALGLPTLMTAGAVGALASLFFGIIILALGPIGAILLVLLILLLSGGGVISGFGILGGGVTAIILLGLVAIAGPILAVIGVVILLILGAMSIIPVILSPIIALMSVLCAPLGAIVGGAGAVAVGFSLFAGGAGAITGITLFGLEGILAFCANFPIFYQIIILCCYPFLMLFDTCLPYIDMLCAPIFAMCGSLIEPVFMLICAPIIELCAGAGLVRVIS